MSSFVINGGNKLYGEVSVQSAKNVMLPLIASCILLDFEVEFLNCPKLYDIIVMLDIIKSLGGKYRFEGDNLYVDCSNLSNYEIPQDLSSKIRASVFSIGAILSRLKKVCFYRPGGCDIGSRPIDMHLSGLRSLGAKYKDDGDAIILDCDNLSGNEITLRYRSVGVTENLIIAGVLSKGTTIIKNCAKEPEIVCLAEFLNGLGGKIKGAGTSTVIIEGVKKLRPRKRYFTPITDRIEVGTYILAVMTIGGEVLINNADFTHNSALIKKIYNNACKIDLFNDKIYVKSVGMGLSHGYLKTAPYPLFPTDLQPQFSVYSSILKGTTIIEEGVFDGRFRQLEELKKFGAKINVIKNTAVIEGVPTLFGAKTKALDLRGGASMVIAGLKAEGETVIDNVEIISRGYMDIDKKFNLLGGNIKRKN